MVEWLRVSGPWAYAIVNPQRPGGVPIDTAGTTLEEAAEYMDGLRTHALLFYANDRWNVVDKAIGPTDAFWYGDPLYQRLPTGHARLSLPRTGRRGRFRPSFGKGPGHCRLPGR